MGNSEAKPKPKVDESKYPVPLPPYVQPKVSPQVRQLPDDNCATNNGTYCFTKKITFDNPFQASYGIIYSGHKCLSESPRDSYIIKQQTLFDKKQLRDYNNEIRILRRIGKSNITPSYIASYKCLDKNAKIPKQLSGSRLDEPLKTYIVLENWFSGAEGNYFKYGDMSKYNYLKRPKQLQEHDLLTLLKLYVELHKKNIYHFDVRGPNILFKIKNRGEPAEFKIIDFGVSEDISGVNDKEKLKFRLFDYFMLINMFLKYNSPAIKFGAIRLNIKNRPTQTYQILSENFSPDLTIKEYIVNEVKQFCGNDITDDIAIGIIQKYLLCFTAANIKLDRAATTKIIFKNYDELTKEYKDEIKKLYPKPLRKLEP